VDKVDAEKIKKDRRLPFGLPGVNKDKQVSNGNYLWISYFHSYLNPTGRAGFVMSSQASSAGHGDAEVRRKLVETGDVDVMISIRSNFFYTRAVPCELWHFDKGKPDDRRDKVLMLDARNIYRKVTRKIYDFSPEQQQNLAAIVWLYRGQTDRFIALVQQYLEKTLTEAAAIAGKAVTFRKAFDALTAAAAPFLKTLSKNSPMHTAIRERDEAANACYQGLKDLTARIGKDWTKPCESKLAAQKKLLASLADLATGCRDLVKDADLAFKLAARVVDAAEKVAGAKDHDEWDGRAVGRLVKDLDAARKVLVEQLKSAAYFERQAHWLLSRFPDGKLVDIPGLVKLVTRREIESADWSLTPGRYVGVAPVEEDEDFDFEQTLRDIHTELADLNKESVELASTIQRNFEELGI
jgi:type I restriction enzyme M protein